MQELHKPSTPFLRFSPFVNVDPSPPLSSTVAFSSTCKKENSHQSLRISTLMRQ